MGDIRLSGSVGFVATVWRNGSSLVVTIRKGVAEKLGLRPGDIVVVEIHRVEGGGDA